MTRGISSLTKLPAGRGLGYARSANTQMPLRVAESQGNISNTATTSASHRTLCGYMPKNIISDGTEIVLTFHNFYIGGATFEQTPGNSYTIEELAIIGPNGTSVAPVYFSGMRTATLADGQTELRSDPVTAASLGLSSFSMQGTLVWLKGRYSVPVIGNGIPQTQVGTADVSGSQGGWYTSPATTLSATDAAGPYALTGTALIATVPPQPIIIGKRTADNLTTHRSVYVQGDSIAVGSTDSLDNTLWGTGYIPRALGNKGTNPIPMLRYARSGIKTANFNASTRGVTYLQYCNTVIDEIGTNDISSETLLTITTGFAQNFTTYTAYGIRDVIKMDLFPNATSTDSWATLANQTVTTHWGAGEKVDQIYTWVDTQVALGRCRRMNLNYCRGNATPGHADWYKWKPSLAADLTHPNNMGHILAGSTLRLQLRDNLAFGLDDIPGVTLLYDASVTATLKDANGVNPAGGGFLGTIATWDDVRGSGYSATQTTAANRPSYAAKAINGVTVPDFDGTTDFMVVPAAPFTMNTIDKGATILTIYLPDNTGTTYIVCNDVVSGNSRFQTQNQGTNFGGTSLSKGVKTSGTPILQVARARLTTQRLKINTDAELTGSVTRDSAAGTFNMGHFPGGSGYVDGGIAYILNCTQYIPGPQLNALMTQVILPGPFGAALTWSDVAY